MAVISSIAHTSKRIFQVFTAIQCSCEYCFRLMAQYRYVFFLSVQKTLTVPFRRSHVVDLRHVKEPYRA
jgi:hypothetical protein